MFTITPQLLFFYVTPLMTNMTEPVYANYNNLTMPFPLNT